MMSLGELLKFLFPDKEVDTAIPIDWVRQASELGIDTRYYVWVIDEENRFGKPVNYLEALLSRINLQNLLEVVTHKGLVKLKINYYPLEQLVFHDGKNYCNQIGEEEVYLVLCDDNGEGLAVVLESVN